jgi:two-component system, NarL family, nitrate/nitrite response regulator NarL
MGERIRILILDDHSLFREGLARLLNSEEGLTVAGACATVDEALSLLSSVEVDVVLLDYDLGNESAADFLRSLSVLKSIPRILMVTAGMSDRAGRESIAAGAVDIIHKHSPPRQLIMSIRKCARGEAPTDLDLRLRMLGTDEDGPAPDSLGDRPLTRRQASALRGILDGLGNREIGEKMNISESSVKAIVQELFHKAGVRTRSQLVRVAIEKHSADWIR